MCGLASRVLRVHRCGTTRTCQSNQALGLRSRGSSRHASMERRPRHGYPRPSDSPALPLDKTLWLLVGAWLYASPRQRESIYAPQHAIKKVHALCFGSMRETPEKRGIAYRYISSRVVTQYHQLSIVIPPPIGTTQAYTRHVSRSYSYMALLDTELIPIFNRVTVKISYSPEVWSLGTPLPASSSAFASSAGILQKSH
jgi:hypothetical protein